MALGPTQPLTEKITKDISLTAKVCGAQGCQPFYHRMPIVNTLFETQSSGALKVFPGLYTRKFNSQITRAYLPFVNLLPTYENKQPTTPFNPLKLYCIYRQV